MTKPFFKLHAAAFAALLCAAGAAQAKTWVLSSDKTGLSGYVLGANIVNSIYSTFEAASGGAANMEDGRGLLHASNSSALPSVPANVDVVVVATVEGNWGAGRGVNPDRFDEVMALVQNRRDLTFVFLNDGCCRPADQTALTGALNTALGLSGPDAISFEAPPAPASAGTQFYVNTNSPYQGSFATPNPVEGVDYRKYTNLPAPYVVYLSGNTTNTAPAMPAPTGKADAYGLLIPRAATNGGACVIAFGDTSHFLTNAPSQPAQLAQNIMHAAKQADGACQVKTVATADLVPSITLSSPLQVGGSGTLTVKVDNLGQSDSAAGGKVVVTLPAQAQVDDTALPTGCSKPAPSEVECTLGAITAQNHKTLTLPITIVGSGIDSTFRAQVTGNSTDTGELAPQLQNNGPIERKVTIAAPTATITGPANAQPNTATTVNGTATGLADGAQVTVTVNGTALQATVTGGNFSVSFPSGFPVGTHAVTVTGPSGWALTQNGTHNINVAAHMPGNVTAVPTLDIWGLGALAALLGAAGLRRQRKG